MNILVVGSGGREHTFVWKLVQSPRCENIFVAPGNAGTDAIATNLNIHPSDFDAIALAVENHQINMLIVGPEEPLVNGIVDYFKSKTNFQDLIIIGPGKEGAQLEGSKDFSKAFMMRHGIPTAEARTFDAQQYNEALSYLENHSYPLVLKADGLAAGKGVIIANNLEESKQALKEILVEKKFREAGSKVLIEDFLVGIELSVFVLSDGYNYLVLPEAKDYKRIGEKDTGPNTGGMGAVSPVPFATTEFLQKVENQVVKPTINGLREDGIDYSGFLFIGLMNVGGQPYVIEYNVRMGDPETQVVFPRIDSDFVDLFEATGQKQLNKFPLQINPKTATTVVAVAGGYPLSYKKGEKINGLEINEDDSITVFHAGTKKSDHEVNTNGGRVLAVTALDDTLMGTKKKAYTRLNKISWEKMYFRNDIADDLLNFS